MRSSLVLGLCAALLPGAASAASEVKLSGPYKHGNLTVFLVHGEDQLKGRKFITLAEAMAKKKVIVHETGNVNELQIENVSNDDVYVQAGEIVKGGRQDRTLSSDFILPKKSGKQPISSFCVESGRWSQRKGEAAGQFSTSENALATKSLKVAARKAKDQGQVWREVEATQGKLAEKVKAPVKSEVSATSLELTLRNGQVEKQTTEYVGALEKLPESHADAVGFVFAINGKLNSAEVYGSPQLFRALWPKLLKSSAVEAISEQGEKATAEPTEQDVHTFLATTDDAKPSEELAPGKRTKRLTKEKGANITFETRDPTSGDVLVHKSHY